MPPAVPWIGVIGPGFATAEELAVAEEVGAGVAAAGAVLVCGGLGGVMEAACRGARSRNGVTVGILPGGDREDANGWVSYALPTGLGEARNALVARSSDALWEVAPPGGGEPGVVAAPDAAEAVRWALERSRHKAAAEL